MTNKFDLTYIECVGVRVPADWTVAQLSQALASRKIRFENESDILKVFGNAVELKGILEKQIMDLQSESIKWEKHAKEKERHALCPNCGVLWIKKEGGK